MSPKVDIYPRDSKGHLTAEGRAKALAAVLAAVQAGKSSLLAIATATDLARPTVRTLLGELGLGATSGNGKTSGKVAVRKNGPKREERVQKRARLAREKAAAKAAKKALDDAEKRIRKAAGTKPKPPKPAKPAPPPDILAPVPGEDLGPDEPDEPEPPKPRGRPKGLTSDLLPGNPGPLDPTIDKTALIRIPEGYDEIERLKKISIAPFIDPGQQIAALRILVGIKGNKGKIDWTAVCSSPESIPEEIRHRLAGMLLGWVDHAELPEAVRAAPLVCRQVYKLTGVLPGTPEAAEAVLERWERHRAELRELAGEVRVETAGKLAPLELSLAAETAYVAPQWEMN